MKKPAQIYKLGGLELLRLYDTAMADDICNFLEGVGGPYPRCEHEARTKPVSDALRDVLELIAKEETRLSQNQFEKMSRSERARRTRGQDTEIRALDRFKDAVECAVQRLAESTPMDMAEAALIAGGVHHRWFEFIARACSPLMYDDQLADIDKKKNQTWAMRDTRDALAYAARVDHERVIERYAELAAGKVRGIRKIVASEFDMPETTVRNIWNSREK